MTVVGAAFDTALNDDQGNIMTLVFSPYLNSRYNKLNFATKLLAKINKSYKILYE